MKVLYDHQIFQEQRSGGISRYFSELIKHYSSDKDIEVSLSLLHTDNIHMQDNPLFSAQKKQKNKTSFISTLFELLLPRRARKKERVKNVKENLNASITSLKKGDFDIFHPTYYNPYFLKYIGSKPFILTIHDMIHEKFPNLFPGNDKTSKQKKELAQKATKIIAVSKNTKRDIMHLLGIPENKIKVIYHGCSLTDTQNITNNNPQMPNKYLLFVGSRCLYKNFVFFLQSISSLLSTNEELFLVCIGSGTFTAEETNTLKNLHIKNKVIQYFPKSDEELSYYYANALAFCFPSKYEGFGFPIIEAFANNCPVLASNTGSLPEIADRAALYFDPNDGKSILSAVKLILHDTSLRKKLINKGQEKLNNFSWKNTAIETKQIYSSIVVQH
ncbi:MAG: glycosyltransferase family 1 protein [bacterium]